MIILDTNVVSGLMANSPHAALVAWIDRQARASVWTTAITVYEVRIGLLRLPAGRRRTALDQAFAAFLSSDIAGRILPFDAAAAEEAAVLDAGRQAAARNIDIRDTQIAGIALARRAGIATRNVRDFADLSVPVVDPWAA